MSGKNVIIQTRNVFLRFMCAIYMFAFASLYIQIPGLYGENGILPAHIQLTNTKDISNCFLKHKSILCLSNVVGLNTSYMMEFLSLTGVALSFLGLVWTTFCNSIVFTLLWLYYLSLFRVGQTFLWFQWDTLLLDLGFLTIFVAPILRNTNGKHVRNKLTMWLVRWALFRLMFASGVVKLQSGCPTWWGLTALNVHYESQCIPTPLAWYFHQLPDWFQSLCVVVTFVIEIGVPFMFFSPLRQHRIFAFCSQLLLQVLIILTGNYNFFNLLTIAMCISLVDDQFLGFKRSNITQPEIIKRGFLSCLEIFSKNSGFIDLIQYSIERLFMWLGFAILFYFSCKYFGISIGKDGFPLSKISFTEQDFNWFMSKAVPFSIAMTTCSLLLTVADCLTQCMFNGKGFVSKINALLSVVGYGCVVVVLFGVSLVPFTTLHQPTQEKIYPVFRQWYEDSQEFNLASSYGLFRHMTGVGGRPELTLEGASDMSGPWKEYSFRYKPGSAVKMPLFVAPHQPRLDWQMWFAALSSYQQNPWLLSLTHRLLSNKKEVTGLLDPDSPFVKNSKPPKFIRGMKYLYHYTSNTASKTWWKREKPSEYMPAFSLESKTFLEYLKQLNLLVKKEGKSTNILLVDALVRVRKYTLGIEHHFLLWGLFIAALVLMITKRLLL